jgi:hypothetical protein
LKFDLGPDIGDAQAAEGAMTSHEKNREKKVIQTWAICIFSESPVFQEYKNT